MQRSASTWAFNVIVKLIQHSYPKGNIYCGYHEGLGEFLQNLSPEYDHLVVKSHTLDCSARILIRTGAAKAVYTYRDPYDAIFSCMRIFEMPFEQALAAIAQSFDVWDFHVSTGTGCVLAYDSITSQPVPSIREVAAYMNLTVDVPVLE